VTTKLDADRDDARAKALKDFVKAATKKEPGAVFTYDSKAYAVPCIRTGALSLDFALGIGGIPRGRIVEIYGPESSGKTSLALSICGQAIKAGGMVGFVDVEHALNPKHMESMGVDKAYVAIAQPGSGEDALQMVETMVSSGSFAVVVVDSVAALVPQAELDGEMSDFSVGAQARLMSKALRKLTGPCAKTNTTLIFINQLRMKIGVLFGSPETTSGGNALKFYASVRLDVRSPAGQYLKDPKDSKRQIGLGTNVKVVKNKVAPPHQKAVYRLVWGQGIDFAASVFDVALDLGILTASSGFVYTVSSTGVVLGRGKDTAMDYLSENPLLADEIAEECYALLLADTVEMPEAEVSALDADVTGDLSELHEQDEAAGAGVDLDSAIAFSLV